MIIFFFFLGKTPSLLALAVVDWNLGESASAEALFQETLEILQQRLGPTHADVLYAHNLYETFRKRKHSPHSSAPAIAAVSISLSAAIVLSIVALVFLKSKPK
jgi:hypothetical protein